MMRVLAFSLCVLMPLSALAQDDASLLAPLAPDQKPKKQKKKHDDLDVIAPLSPATRAQTKHRKPAPAASAAKPAKKAVAAHPGKLAVQAGHVPGAKVRVDEIAWGEAPVAARPLPPGKHLVSVERKGFAPFKRWVVVRRGRTVTVNAHLKATRGVLTVRTQPPGAEVSLDGAIVGVSPLEERLLAPGSYELKLRLDGYMEEVSRLQLRAGKDLVVDRTLIAAPAKDDRPQVVSLIPRSAGESPRTLAPLTTSTEVEPPSPWYKHWYVWAGAGAVVAAAAVGIAASSGGTTVGAPPSPGDVCGGPCDGVLTP